MVSHPELAVVLGCISEVAAKIKEKLLNVEENHDLGQLALKHGVF